MEGNHHDSGMQFAPQSSFIAEEMRERSAPFKLPPRFIYYQRS